jgi:4-hydroxy 2-oxovalerate aldolase
MMNSGEFNISQLRDDESEAIFGIRVVFHEHQAKMALNECAILKEKGYRAFLQPMGTDSYSDKELLNLIEKANEIEPYAFYFVDSLGVMNGDDIIRMALLIHNNLKPGIKLGFHPHNNLQQASSNVQELVNMGLKRELIIDGSTYGMGRGAGNLHTELIANYLNEKHDTAYDVDWILRVYDEHIRSLREKFTWGYSIQYYLAAIHKVHPNYGTYLVNRATLPVTDIGVLLSSIPPKNKRQYSEKLIEELYSDYLANNIDDTDAYDILIKALKDKPLLLLGPGNSLLTHSSEITEFINESSPVVISINHAPEIYAINYAFFSNKKRFEERRATDDAYIITSNIEYSDYKAIKVNYSTLCNQQGRFSDNAALMLLSLLMRIGCKSVYIAGLDGYSCNDYYDKDMQNITDRELMESVNTAFTDAISQYSQRMRIQFITPSIYIKNGAL